MYASGPFVIKSLTKTYDGCVLSTFSKATMDEIMMVLDCLPHEEKSTLTIYSHLQASIYNEQAFFHLPNFQVTIETFEGI